MSKTQNTKQREKCLKLDLITKIINFNNLPSYNCYKIPKIPPITIHIIAFASTRNRISRGTNYQPRSLMLAIH